MFNEAPVRRVPFFVLIAIGSSLALTSAKASEAETDESSETGAGEAPIPFMEADDYRLYRRYEAALRDPRVEAIPEAHRMRRIARNFDVSLRRLREVVELGDEIAEGQLERQEHTIKEALEETPVKGRVRSIELVERRGIVVAYVGWIATEQDRVVPEAAYIAKAVADAAPVVNLVAMWGCLGRHKVFTARIQTSSASRFRLSRIDDFAETRYIRLFEEVRNRFTGEPPEDNIGCG